MQNLAKNVIREMGLVGVMAIASGLTTSAKTNLKLQLLQQLLLLQQQLRLLLKVKLQQQLLQPLLQQQQLRLPQNVKLQPLLLKQRRLLLNKRLQQHLRLLPNVNLQLLQPLLQQQRRLPLNLKIQENVKIGIAIVRGLNVMVIVQRIIFIGCLKIARNHVISVQEIAKTEIVSVRS